MVYENCQGIVVLLENAQGAIALQLRDDKPGTAGRGLWGLFGGLLEENESPAEAAVREIYEELGVRLIGKKLMLLGIHETEWNLRTYVFRYLVNDELERAELKEGQRFEFIPRAAVAELNVVSHHLEILALYWLAG